MVKRYLNLSASEIKKLTAKDFLDSVKMSEGRILISETVVVTQPILNDITNAEICCAFGADAILLNVFDAKNPVIQGMPKGIEPKNLIRELKELTGRVIGVNLEPVDPKFVSNNDKDEFSLEGSGRIATKENAQKLVEMGATFVVLTGNPGNGVSNDAIFESIKEIKSVIKDDLAIIAGKMHAAGVLEELMTKNDIDRFVKAGADVILIPSVGSVPGMDVRKAKELIDYAHEKGVLVLTALGTSQEGSDVETIRQIAFYSKMAGPDIHHIGDAGLAVGMALAENIKAYSVAIRGVRHTYMRMAKSVKR